MNWNQSSNHLSAEAIHRYKERTLLPKDLKIMEEHSKHCEQCRYQLIDPSQVRAMIQNLITETDSDIFESSEHFSQSELSKYVYKQDDPIDRELVESHLEICPSCSRSLGQLEALSGNSIMVHPLSVASGFKDNRFILAGYPFISWSSRKVISSVGTVVFLVLIYLTWSILRHPLSPQKIVRQSVPTNQNISKSSQENQFNPIKIKNKERQFLSQIDRLEKDKIVLKGVNQDLTRHIKQLKLDLRDAMEETNKLRKSLVAKVEPSETDKALKLLASLAGSDRGHLGDESRMVRSMPNVPSSEGTTIPLISPVATLLQDVTPTLHWKEVQGAKTYKIIIITDKTYTEVANGIETKNEWKVPKALTPGKVYLWEVSAKRDGKEMRSKVARFKLISREDALTLRPANRLHLKLGILYTRARLFEDAKREFRAIPKGDPAYVQAQKNLEALTDKNSVWCVGSWSDFRIIREAL